MSESHCRWRHLTPEQREEVRAWRKSNARPWHSPQHLPNHAHLHYLISAACYEHAPHIGFSPRRMDDFSAALTTLLHQQATNVIAWCVLPNHYHALIETPNILAVVHALGRLRSRSSHAWNGEEGTGGCQVFHRCAERFMRSERHLFATLNYVHHSAVYHGWVTQWTEWLWENADEYLEQMGVEGAKQRSFAYPIDGYGKKWDAPAL